MPQESELLGFSQHPSRRGAQSCQDLPKSTVWGGAAGDHYIRPALDCRPRGFNRHCRLEAGLLYLPSQAGTVLHIPWWACYRVKGLGFSISSHVSNMNS